MKRPIYLENMTYRMIEYVANKNDKKVLDFSTAFT